MFFEPRSAAVDLLDIRRELAGEPGGLSTERLLELSGLFRGDLLEDLAVPDLPDFTAWLLTEKEAARRTRASLLRVLVERLYAAGRKDCVLHAGEQVAVDPYSVSAHATFIRTLSAAGHRKEAERRHEISRKELAEAGARDLQMLTDALIPVHSAAELAPVQRAAYVPRPRQESPAHPL